MSPAYWTPGGEWKRVGSTWFESAMQNPFFGLSATGLPIEPSDFTA